MNEELDSINQDLEQLEIGHFMSLQKVEDELRRILQGHDMDFPGGLSEDEDNIFKIEGHDDLFLYVIVDKEMLYSVFAQILGEDDIIDIQNNINEPPQSGTSDFLRRVRHSDD